MSFAMKYTNISLSNAPLMNQFYYSSGSLINELNNSLTCDKNYTLTEPKNEDFAILWNGPVVWGQSLSLWALHISSATGRKYPTPRAEVGLQWEDRQEVLCTSLTGCKSQDLLLGLIRLGYFRAIRSRASGGSVLQGLGHSSGEKAARAALTLASMSERCHADAADAAFSSCDEARISHGPPILEDGDHSGPLREVCPRAWKDWRAGVGAWPGTRRDKSLHLTPGL